MGLKDFGYRGIRGNYFHRLNLAEAGSWASDIAMSLPSDQEIETYKWLGDAAQMREWIGARLAKKMRDYVYTIQNKKFESTLEIDVDDIRRDKTGQIKIRINEMAVKTQAHWERLLTDLILANGLTYDSKAFFAVDHQSGDSGVQNNKLTKVQLAAAQVVVPANPTALELSALFVQAAAYFSRYKDDTGEPVNDNAKKFTVMIPAEWQAAADTALSVQYLGNGVTNVAKSSRIQFNLLTNARLTDATKMRIFRTDGAMKPLIMQTEMEPTASFLGEGSDSAFHDDKYKFGIKAWRNVGYGLWNHAIEVQLAV